jgi:two-component system chemotaxis sensor kinase CheA
MPQLGLQELVRLRQEGGQVEHVHGAPVYRLRGRLLPLIWLAESLGLQTLSLEEKQRAGGHILVLQVQDSAFGLVVDEVTNSEEIVVKPIAEILSGVEIYAGTTILGDGQVALILDAGNLVAQARVGEGKSLQNLGEREAASVTQVAAKSYVLCEFPDDARVAVPLEQVERLEKFRAEVIETRDGCAAIQYRKEVIPLVRLEDGLGTVRDVAELADQSGLVHTLIYREGSQRVGLTVRRILDVVELGEKDRRGEGVAVVDGRLTTLFDLRLAVRRLLPMFFPEGFGTLQEAS